MFTLPKHCKRWAAVCGLLAGGSLPLSAQEGPRLLFREDWKEIPEQTPVNQQHVSNPDLTLHLYGPGRTQLKKSHHLVPAHHPYYIWSGPCPGNWALALEHSKLYLDLTGNARVRWRTHQSGFRQLRLLVKLANDTWLVSDQFVGPSQDWREQEMLMADVRWYKINIDKVTEGGRVEKPDLSRVVQIGFTDLMAGGQSGASSRVDWLEVYGKPVAR